MTTMRELCEVLAAALGVEPGLVKGHAHALREDGVFPADEADTDAAQVEPEHAADLAREKRLRPKINRLRRSKAWRDLGDLKRER